MKFLFPYKGVLSLSMCKNIVDLFTPASRVEALIAEAAQLPKLNITLLDCQWVQVKPHLLTFFCFHLMRMLMLGAQ